MILERLALAVLAGLVSIMVFLFVLYATGHRIVDTDARPSGCLAPVQEWPLAKQRWVLGLAEGTDGPPSGTCQADRLEWLRAQS